MFIPVWLFLLLAFVWIPWLIYKTRQDTLHALLNPDWLEWKKNDDEMEKREGCRQISETEPTKYLSSPECVLARKAQIATRPVLEDGPLSHNDRLAMRRFRIFWLVENYDQYLTYMNAMYERALEEYPDAHVQKNIWTKEEWDREYEFFSSYRFGR
jgi:hypothetical protein